MKRWLKSLLALVVLATSVSAIVVPVSVVNDPARRIEHGITIAKVVEQIRKAQELIQLAKENRDWRDLMAGGWRRILKRLPGKEADRLNREIVKLEEMGWPVGSADDIERWRRLGPRASAIAALEILRQVADGKRREAEQVRNSQEQVWGEVPITREGIKVEAAYRQMAQITVEQGRINEALRETYENVVRLQSDLNGAQVIEDRNRTAQLLSVEVAKLQSLQIRAQLLVSQGQVQTLGMSAGSIVSSQEAAMREREEMQSMMSAAGGLSMRAPRGGGGEE